VSARLTEAVESPVAETVAASDRAARSRPADGATLIDVVAAGSTLPVLGTFDGFLLVRDAGGRQAWVRADTQD
jgi:hypothetical protein